MAASSPVLSNNSSETTTTITSTPTATNAVKSPSLPTITLQRPEPPKNLRGLNKPKCIKCGNVARSRCPYQSCKSCCSKAQNPCHIHVLKPNATLADRGASPNSTIPEQQSSDVPSSGPSAKVSSLRQLSSTFAQFNNVHIPLRSRKPLTRKEALAINEWRFSKLKEYNEGNIEAENAAFDRYMQNISLLEEVFHVNSTAEGDKMDTISEIKVKLRSNPLRISEFRKRIRSTIDQGLRKLRKCDSSDGDNNLNEGVLDPTPNEAKKWWVGKRLAVAELNDKLNKARNEEDLKMCIEIRSKIKGQQKESPKKKTESTEIPKEEEGVPKDLPSVQESDSSLLKLVKTTEIDQGALSSVDSYFSTLEEIEDL